MTPLYKEHVLDFGDLKLLGVVCKKCGAEIILDVSKSEPVNLTSCTSCGQDFDHLFLSALDFFHKAYIGFLKDSQNFSVRVRIRSQAKAIE